MPVLHLTLNNKPVFYSDRREYLRNPKLVKVELLELGSRFLKIDLGHRRKKCSRQAHLTNHISGALFLRILQLLISALIVLNWGGHKIFKNYLTAFKKKKRIEFYLFCVYT